MPTMYQTQPRKRNGKFTFPSPKLHLYFQSRAKSGQLPTDRHNLRFRVLHRTLRVAFTIHVSHFPLAHTKLNPFPESSLCRHKQSNPMQYWRMRFHLACRFEMCFYLCLWNIGRSLPAITNVTFNKVTK